MVPAVAAAGLVELGTAPVPVHYGGPPGHDLPGLAVGKLAVVGIHDANLHHGRRPPVRADAADPQRVVRQHPHDLRLTVPTGVAGPAAGVGRHHRVPLGSGGRRPQRVEVVAPVGIRVSDLGKHRSDQERAGAALGLDQPAELLGVDASCEDVGAALYEGRQRVHERADVEQRSGVEVHERIVDPGEVPEHEALRDERGVAQHRPVRPAREGGRVDHEQRRPRVAVAEAEVVRLFRPTRGQHPLVSVVTGRVVLHPTSAGARSGARVTNVPADLLLLPEHDPGVEVVDDERELLGALAPVGRAEHRAQLGRGEQALGDAKGVLAEPQDPVGGTDARFGQGVGEPVHALVEFRIRGPVPALDDRRRIGTTPCVLAQDIGKRQRASGVHGGMLARR